MGAKKIADSTTELELIAEVSRVISEITGVQLGAKQIPLVQGRLSKRMRDLRITEPLEYSRYYNANQSIEIGILISLLTTHHTFFFREFQHFEYLLKVSLPIIITSHRKLGLKTIRIWSAACSRGQEVYSLAMFLRVHLLELAPEMNYEIVGTDICEESIAIAKNGVYAWDELRTVPSVYLQGNWSKGAGDISNFVRAKDEIRRGVSFSLLNLQELSKSTVGGSSAKFDVIFSRNVFIYFNHTQIKVISSECLKILNPIGHFFVGLSESLNGLGLPIEWVGPSVYEQKKAPAEAKILPLRPADATHTQVPASLSANSVQKAAVVAKSKPQVSPRPEVLETANTFTQKKVRVLCVDDSPTVLLLLKRILSSNKGFEIVGTASDGIEAAEKVKLLKPDVLTLDIHMPRMTGVEFLEKHFKDINAPVVVVSSVPRDDAALAFRCLELGASDYIEKPSAQNFDKVEEELIFKIRVAESAWRQAVGGPTRSRALELDASFRRPPQMVTPNGKLRLIIANFASRDVATVLFKGFQGTQPGTLVLVEGAGEVLEQWVKFAATQIAGGKTREPTTLEDLKPGNVHFMEMEKGARLFMREGKDLVTSCLVVGPLSRNMVQMVSRLSVNQMMIEDRGAENPSALLMKAHLIVPLTSFAYESNRFLAESDQKSGGSK